MKKLLAAIILIITFASCADSYSPIDNYVNTMVQRSQDSTKEVKMSKDFIKSFKKSDSTLMYKIH